MNQIYEINRYEIENGVVIAFRLEGTDSRAEFALFCTPKSTKLTDYESFYGNEENMKHDIETHLNNYDYTSA